MQEFLQDLFGDAVTSRCRLVVFTAPAPRWRHFADLAQAVAYAQKQSGTLDLYFGVGLIRRGTRGRGTAADVTAIGALWADIDLAGEAHPDKPLPTTIDEALGLLDDLPLGPSLVVDSGHGLHAYWLLKEPWVFDSAEERGRAARLARGWHGLVCLTAARHGWRLQNLGDLARVLRLPGTTNYKTRGAPVPVQLRARYPERRYLTDDFEPYLVEEPLLPAADGKEPRSLHPDAQPPAEKLELALQESPQFRLTWERQREDLQDSSQSGYDLSLATMAALRGWTDTEIAALIVTHRHRHGQHPEKAMRQDYVQRTIKRARSAADACAEEVDLSRLLAALSTKPGSGAPPDPGPFPRELLQVPGLVGEIVAYNLETAIRPQPVLALAGALCLQAVLAARKVCDERGNRTNLYGVGVASSGRGKDHAGKVNRNLLLQAGLDGLEGSEDVASDAGLVAAVDMQPGLLLQFDEFGRFLRTVGDPRKAPHLYNVVTTLMKLYSAADTLFRGKAYADPKRNKVIQQPCVSVYGTTVPEHFYESLTAEALQDGFVARLLVFEGDDRAPRQRVPQKPVPASILEIARWWERFTPGGNLAQEHPEPRVVATTPEAATLFDELATAVDDGLAGADGASRALWARAEEKACRLALVYACSANHTEPVIDLLAGRWACALSRYLTQRMLFLAHQWVADGLFDARQKKVLRVIRDAGGEIGHSDLYSKTRSLTPRERQEVLENLVQTGQIEVQIEPTATKPRVRYTLR
jgi:hypothetical protein